MIILACYPLVGFANYNNNNNNNTAGSSRKLVKIGGSSEPLEPPLVTGLDPI